MCVPEREKENRDCDFKKEQRDGYIRGIEGEQRMKKMMQLYFSFLKKKIKLREHFKILMLCMYYKCLLGICYVLGIV